MTAREHPSEAQEPALPGVRPGQVWHEVKPKRRYRAYDWTVCNVTGIDVVRDGFEQRYRLVSEGGAPDA